MAARHRSRYSMPPHAEPATVIDSPVLRYALSVTAGPAALLLVLVLWPMIGTAGSSALLDTAVFLYSMRRRLGKRHRTVKR
jgi:hypothetical protein